jgi:hypothetical protein
VSFRMQGVGFTPPLFGASAWGFLKKEVNLELCGGIDRKTCSRMETSIYPWGRGFFPNTRGLRQGDHFSLLVYHCNGGVESDVGKGVCWGLHFRLFYWQFLWDALSVSNLLFMDDTLILINFGIYKVFLYGFRPFLV